MSVFDRLKNRFRRSDGWKKAEGVLPVERALADEHEMMHGERISADLAAVTVEFDPAQIIDIPGFARDLRDALGPRDSGIHVAAGMRAKLEPDLTPRDAIGQLLLRNEPLRTALRAYESAPQTEHSSASAAFAAALASAFNTLLDRHLMDDPAFRSFIEAGAVDALGDATGTEAQAEFVRRANRELLEAAYPRELALMRDRRLAIVFNAARKRDTAALCLSGGGIRSSTFALGIMQGLARNGLLGKFDYLSTVSGGGLSGGWLSAWMRRDGAETVHDALRTPGREKLQPDPEPVQGLRAFSQWLTPRGGAMSIDSWTVIATVFRNMFLNWLVLVPLLAGLVMLPRLLLSVLAIEYGRRPDDFETKIGLTILGGVTLILLASVYIEFVRDSGEEVAKGRRHSPTQAKVLAWFIVPLVLGSMIVVTGLWIDAGWEVDPVSNSGIAIAAALLATVVVVATALIRRRGLSVPKALMRAGKVIVSGLIGYGLAMVLLYLMSEWDDEWQRGLYMTLGPAVVLLGSVITSQLYTGFTSNEASDAEREWSARANAWVLIVAIVWLVASGLVLLGPGLVAGLWRKLTLLGVGGVTSWLTVHLGKQPSAPAGGKPSSGNAVRNAALSLVMPVVVACMIIGLAAANDESINRICTGSTLTALFECSPPAGDSPDIIGAADSTAAPMLSILARAKLGELNQVHRQIAGMLAVPDTDGSWGAVTNPRAAVPVDTQLITASHRETVLALSFDSIEVRRIRRLGLMSAEFDTVKFTQEDLQEWIGQYTAQRNAILASHGKSRTGTLPVSDSLLNLTQGYLATRAALNADMRVRAADTVALHHMADSVLNVRAHAQPGNKALWAGVLLVMALMIGAGQFFSTVVNTNTFSLHAMWKTRTVRAFLGTTRAAEARNPNPFTGFDSDDDVPLRDLWPARKSDSEHAHEGERSEAAPPLHVLNVTLNLAAGNKLAWQQRKGESMTFTPLHAGSAFTGYRRMQPSQKPGTLEPGYGGKNGASLGTAMAISGAAVSPDDGAGTTALSSFLLTFFNARLGSWLGNPGAPGVDTWQRPAPKQRLTPILSEMFGRTNDRSAYVYLSDGGHFENLALYEMVFRRCRFIVVSDAGADPKYTFEDLGNAVRKVRIDFGVPIDFDEPVKIKSRDKKAGAYWATARIRYSAVDMPHGGDPDDYDGVLLYVKPAVYGIEPRDVVNYSKLSKDFPQESSADQFFTESQFESYRELGSWIIDELVANPSNGGAPVIVKGQRKESLLSAWPNLAKISTRPSARTRRSADPAGTHQTEDPSRV